MSNNQICNFLGAIGMFVSAVSFIGCFFGFNAWIPLACGMVTMGISSANYD